MTYTYVNLVVSDAAYQEIKGKLLLAGYDWTINEDGEIDMHGIALVTKNDQNRDDEPKSDLDEKLDRIIAALLYRETQAYATYELSSRLLNVAEILGVSPGDIDPFIARYREKVERR